MRNVPKGSQSLQCVASSATSSSTLMRKPTHTHKCTLVTHPFFAPITKTKTQLTPIRTPAHTHQCTRTRTHTHAHAHTRTLPDRFWTKNARHGMSSRSRSAVFFFLVICQLFLLNTPYVLCVLACSFPYPKPLNPKP